MTDVTRNMNVIMRYGDACFTPVMLLLRKIRSQGAATSVYVATEPDLDGVGGKYFFHCKSEPTGAVANDLETAAKLWEISLQVTKYK
jgi:hypothetical protein